MEYMQNFDKTKGLLHLEDRLAKSLRPVRPDPVFIHSLREKLAQGSTTMVEYRQNHYGFLTIGLGLAAGALIIWLLRRLK